MEHIREVIASNERLLNSFGLEKIESRFLSLHEKALNFLGAEGLNDAVKIDRLLLVYTLVDYFTDILRIKEFHNIELVNPIKVAAYEAYWFVRRHPFQVIESSPKALFINERFAIMRLAEELLGHQPSGNETINSSTKFFWQSLMYYLKYRKIDPQSLELFLLSYKAGEIKTR